MYGVIFALPGKGLLVCEYSTYKDRQQNSFLEGFFYWEAIDTIHLKTTIDSKSQYFQYKFLHHLTNMYGIRIHYCVQNENCTGTHSTVYFLSCQGWNSYLSFLECQPSKHFWNDFSVKSQNFYQSYQTLLSWLRKWKNSKIK